MADCATAAEVAGGPFKFTVTSPYMLARLVLDEHYHDFAALTLAIASVLAEQVEGLPCSCLQVDEASLVETPQDGPLAAEAINIILDRFRASAPCTFASATTAGRPFAKATGRR